MTSVSPGEDRFPDDEELAAFERAIELRDPVPTLLGTKRNEEHRSAFELIDALAAPIRMAIRSFDRPPILEEYEALTEIARGGMGIIYRGLHKKTQRMDAIKVMRIDRFVGNTGAAKDFLRTQFLRECQLAARVAHEHIVPVYQVGETEDRPWFSMQLVDGCSLHELTRTASIETERVVRYIEQIARAIDVVHRHGILHGDIKPQNVLIESQTDRPMLSDFGLADWQHASPIDPNAGIAGTPAFMAPELANAALHGGSCEDMTAMRTVSSDVYSLGATLWSALCGRYPCSEDQPPRQQLAEVANGNSRIHREDHRCIPTALMRTIKKCVAQSPESRFSSAGELADALSGWLERPRWNRHFPKLSVLLCVAVAPILLLSCLIVQWLIIEKMGSHWIWMALFSGYAPLFAAFWTSQRSESGARRAHRELWSIWLGHLCVSIAVAIVLHRSFPSDRERVFELFFPFWAALSALVFFAKSGNFWAGYRWIGVAWSLIAIGLATTPWAPVLFGLGAVVTCILLASADRASLDS